MARILKNDILGRKIFVFFHRETPLSASVHTYRKPPGAATSAWFSFGKWGNEITPAIAASNGEASTNKVWERSFFGGCPLGRNQNPKGPRPCARQGGALRRAYRGWLRETGASGAAPMPCQKPDKRDFSRRKSS